MNTLKSIVIIREGAGQIVYVPMLVSSFYGLITSPSRDFSYENWNINFNFACVLAICKTVSLETDLISRSSLKHFKPEIV